MRVAVIGSGIVGSSVAWHLAQRQAEVVMIDAGQPGTGVTNWTFSWVNASNKTETREYFDLNLAGMSAYRELATSLGAGDWWHPTGHLRWTDDAIGAEALGHSVQQLQAWGYDATLWEAARVRRVLEPDVCFPSDDTEVALYRDEGWIDGHHLVNRLVEGVVAEGGEVHTGRAVVDIVVQGERVTEVVVTGGQRHPVDAVVNATGPAASRVAALIGRTLPMREEPGVVARVRCDRVPIGRAMHAPHVELRPDRPGYAVLHSREIDALIDPTSDLSDLSGRLHRLAVEAVPNLRHSELSAATVSWRPIPGDGFPSVGGIDQLSGYFEAVTHSGITLGLVVGRLLAEEIIDGTVDTLIKPYRPSRF